MTTYQWQPIKTAPKDGTEIDLWVVFKPYRKRPVGARLADCRWEDNPWPDEVEDEDVVGWYQRVSTDACVQERVSGEATHWMPKPGPPQDT